MKMHSLLYTDRNKPYSQIIKLFTITSLYYGSISQQWNPGMHTRRLVYIFKVSSSFWSVAECLSMSKINMEGKKIKEKKRWCSK